MCFSFLLIPFLSCPAHIALVVVHLKALFFDSVAHFFDILHIYFKLVQLLLPLPHFANLSVLVAVLAVSLGLITAGVALFSQTFVDNLSVPLDGSPLTGIFLLEVVEVVV